MQANLQPIASCRGMCSRSMKGWLKKSSKDSLIWGSLWRSFRSRSLHCSDTSEFAGIWKLQHKKILCYQKFSKALLSQGTLCGGSLAPRLSLCERWRKVLFVATCAGEPCKQACVLYVELCSLLLMYIWRYWWPCMFHQKIIQGRGGGGVKF